MSPVLQYLINWVENRFPGSKEWIDLALQYISPTQVTELILQTIHDYQAGMSFIDILKDLLKQNVPTEAQSNFQ